MVGRLDNWTFRRYDAARFLCARGVLRSLPSMLLPAMLLIAQMLARCFDSQSLGN